MKLDAAGGIGQKFTEETGEGPDKDHKPVESDKMNDGDKTAENKENKVSVDEEKEDTETDKASDFEDEENETGWNAVCVVVLGCTRQAKPMSAVFQG